MPTVGRSSSAYLAGVALAGLSGCLLFTDPINEAPKVIIEGPVQVVRHQPAEFKVVSLEDEDDLGALEWGRIDARNEGCSGITNADWGEAVGLAWLDRNAPYGFTPETVRVVCVCARATDRHGAVGLACQRVAPVNAPPIARIADVQGYVSGQARPLCSEVRLSAASSDFPRDPAADQVTFNWALDYGGGEPGGQDVELGECADLGGAGREQQRCFRASVPGTYTVSLSITDTPLSGGGAPLTSPTVAFVALVAPDAPPCLRRTEPDVYAQRILLSRTSDLGTTYESRTFTVLSAADDCSPYPATASAGSAQFVWSVYDATKANPRWEYLASREDSLTVTQSMFLNALPGDVIKVRVEVRDAAVQELYKTPGYAACPDETDLCCGPGGCTGSNDCIRWTTWTVQFQP